jgi:hypothetical protein
MKVDLAAASAAAALGKFRNDFIHDSLSARQDKAVCLR